MSHNCAGWSLYGAIGDEDLYFGDDQNEEGRGMYNRKPNRSSDKSNVVRIKSLSWKEVKEVMYMYWALKLSFHQLEAQLDLAKRIDTVIMDCEGCWIKIVDLYFDIFKGNIKKLIIGK